MKLQHDGFPLFITACMYILLHAVSSLVCRYDDDHIPGGDKERYAR